MIALFLHADAEQDLEELWEANEEAAARITVLFEELKGNSDLLDRLTQRNYGEYGTKQFHVTTWDSQWNQGIDLWRLKLWDLEDSGLRYRIVYAFMPRQQHYHILAIAPRDFNYDPEHPISKRILKAYEDIS